MNFARILAKRLSYWLCSHIVEYRMELLSDAATQSTTIFLRSENV